MNYVALRMLMGERAKYLGLIFAIAFSTFLLENQTSIFAGILKRTASQVLDVTDADVWVMDPRTQYFEQTARAQGHRSLPRPRRAGRAFRGAAFQGHAGCACAGRHVLAIDRARTR
jgi:hypothetical protein